MSRAFASAAPSRPSARASLVSADRARAVSSATARASSRRRPSASPRGGRAAIPRGDVTGRCRRAARRAAPARAFLGGGAGAGRADPFADDGAFGLDADPALLPTFAWSAEVRVRGGRFDGHVLLASAFTREDVPVVADLLLGSGMAGFPLERRTLEVYLAGAVPAFPHGTYLVGRLRAPKECSDDDANAVSDASVSDDASVPSDACSSWSEEKAARHGPVVACVGVSFDESTRRTFTSLSPPGDAAYLSDLVVSERERGEGLGRAMLEAAETFAAEMRAPAMYLHVAMKKPGVVRLYKEEGYGVAGVDPGVFGWRGRLLMRKTMQRNVKGEREAASEKAAAKVSAVR